MVQLITMDSDLQSGLALAAQHCIHSLEQGGKVLLCGNGGSAADAQHISAELAGRFLKDRPAIHAEALHVNSSYLTAVGNDYDFDRIYARAVEAKGKAGDVLIGLSTSGNSANIVQAIEEAKDRDMVTIALTGSGGGKLREVVDLCLCVPSTETPRIQEAHILMGHIICDIIERSLFP
ncbi:MAG: SIS domain-containing protein [Saprospiraceae bacterium]|nr:SIS domain-containing protein [Saprospiraceae bacterium]